MDITQRWDAIEQFFRGIADPRFLLDRAGKILFVSAPFAGRDVGALAGLELASLFAPEHRDRVNATLARTSQIEACAQGRWYALQASVVDDCVFVVATDVTKQHEEVERLRRSEQMMVDTQGVAHIGTWEWDPREPTAHWSPELFKIYGLDPSSHAPSYEDYLTRVHPDDRDRVIKATEGVFRDFKKYSHDERVFRPDGEQRYLHTWAEAVVDEHGKLERLVGVCQDITDRKRAELALVEGEARYRAIFEHSGIGIATVTERGDIADCNSALELILRRQRDEIVGNPLATMLTETAHAGRIADVFASGGVGMGEAHVLRGDGTVSSVELTMTLVRAAQERPAFAVVTIEDVSTRREIEEKTRLAQSRLERIQELEGVSEWKSHVLNIASHELKNPLAPITLQLAMLLDGRRGALSAPQRDEVASIYGQIRRLNSLVRDMQDTALIEQRRLSLNLDVVDLGADVRRVVESFRSLGDDWNVRLSVDVADDLKVRGDADRLQQVMFNLLSNAFKFTPSSGLITVRAMRKGGDVHVSVTDTGPGLDEAQRARLFHAFSQVHEPSPTDREFGVGLGLFVSKVLVDAHGGRIWVDSKPGEGSTFQFTVPALGV